MRNALFTLLLSVAGALGMTVIPGNAQAYDNTRIYVHLGDVGFSYGRPYWRHDNTPLYVTYDRYHRPRYYRHGPRRVYRRDYYEPYYESGGGAPAGGIPELRLPPALQRPARPWLPGSELGRSLRTSALLPQLNERCSTHNGASGRRCFLWNRRRAPLQL